MSLVEFVKQYFLGPIQIEQGYNVYNTIAYALAAFAVLYLLHKIFERIKLKMDFKFFIALLPYIFFGSFTRILVDNNIFNRTFWTVSPGIYLLTAGVFLTALTLALIGAKYSNLTYWQFALIYGLIIDVAVLIYGQALLPENIIWGAISIVIVTAISLVFLQLFKVLHWKWFTTKLGFSAIVAHIFDATNTFLLVDFFGGIEKHPLPRLIINKTSTGLAFFPLKLAVVLPAIYLISTSIENQNWRNLLLISIATLGFAEGLRNLFNLIL